MEKNPIVLTDGQLEQLQNGDYLPNQPDIDALNHLVALIVLELKEQGFHFESEEINSQLKLLK